MSPAAPICWAAATCDSRFAWHFEGKIALITGASSGLGARFAKVLAQAGALTKALAGGPYLLARLLDYSVPYVTGPAHEYGTTLLLLAGLFNLLTLSDGLKLHRKESK